jgi:hypothetical protein
MDPDATSNDSGSLTQTSAPAGSAAPAGPAQPDADGSSNTRAREQIRRWAQDLLDLSRRNTSLYYKPLTRGTLTFIAPRPADIHAALAGSRPLSIYYPPPADLLDGQWTVNDSLREATTTQLVSDRTDRTDVEKVLRNLHSHAHGDFVDRGIESLYLCFGVLRWRERPGAEVISSPLIFVPVRLERESPREPYRIRRSGGDAVLNPSLRVLMEEMHGVALPEHIAESPADQDLAGVLEDVAAAVGEPGWAVESLVVLKRATFHKEAMYRDLLDNLELVAGHPIVAAIADPTSVPDQRLADIAAIPAENDVDDVIPPEQSHLIRDADASQRRAIAAALHGASFVMDGPPGTGKSQTISNLIAELIAQGKTVLFVSEKIAALDVVADRLRERGLADFLLELHSHKVSRREVAAELGRALRFHPTARPRLGAAELQQYRRHRESLSEYAAAVNRVREPLGRSVHWVVGRLAQLDGLVTVPPPAGISAELAATDVAELLSNFERLARVWEPAERADMFAWRGLQVAGLNQAMRHDLLRTVDRLADGLRDLEDVADGTAFASGVPTPDDLGEAERLAALCVFVTTQPVTEARWWTRPELEDVATRMDEIAALAAAHAEDVQALEAGYGAGWQDLAARPALSAHAALTALTVSAAPSEHVDLDAVRQRLGFLRRTRELSESLSASAADLAASLGARIRERSAGETRELAEVASEADAPVRPEARWATPAGAARAQQAITVLGPLVRDYRDRRDNLTEVFEEGVYDLDLRGLVTRFQDVHRGLRKLGGAYRADKQAVAQLTRSRRATKAVRKRLADALELQQLMVELDQQEAEHREPLGRYYRRRGSDFDGAARALARLHRATEVLGTEYDADRVAAQLGGDAPADPGLGMQARRLVDEIDAWQDAAAQAGFEPVDLAVLPLSALREWADRAAPETETLHEAYAAAARIRVPATDLAGFLDDVGRRVAVDGRIQAMQAAAARDVELLGRFSGGLDTDVPAARQALEWVRELRHLFGAPLAPRAVQQLHGRPDPPDPTPLRGAIAQVIKLTEAFAARFDGDRREQLQQELTGRLTPARDLVRELLDHPEQIDTWERFVALTDELRQAGWAAPLHACAEVRIPADQVLLTLEKAMYTAWFDAVAATDRAIGQARAADLDAMVARFRSLDRELIDNAAEWVVAKCTERRPRTTMGAAGIIEREVQKKTRHMPVRTLLGKVGDVAQQLKPCFMMSPLSVSQFIPPGLRFDVVIFDEASQITPADAVNCIYRGDQLVVAGDDRQLPPTSFFERTADEAEDSYDEEQFDEFESMLDLCKGAASLPSLPLRWHYRSRDESLITFSNYTFYDGSLITYPGARTDGVDLGMELFVVDGVYRRGTSRDNRIEAETVADRVFYHAENHPELTVGVVTFSQAQAEMVERVIEERRMERPDLDNWFTSDRLDGFFVKNLESVQGDERDVIVFSVGYGPDETGRMTLAFGPLSTNGGWRRLNVAITRARRRVEAVASFHPRQLDARSAKHRGVRELLRYLDYAERGPAALAVAPDRRDASVPGPLEQSVFATLAGWGYEVVPRVGAAGYRIDLGVRHPDRPGSFLLGVELDGPTYGSSRITRDRDRLRQEVLEGLGWRLHRVWGPSWYLERREQEQRLRDALERAAAGESPPAVKAPGRRDRVERAHEQAPLDQPPDWTAPYRVARVRADTDLYPYAPAAFSETVRVARAVLDVEAPIHADLLARRVAQAFGCNLTRQVRQAVDDAVLTLERREACRRAGAWVWVDDIAPVRVPGDDPETRRDIEHIPPPEVDEAILRLLGDAGAATDEEILVRIGRLFGVQRLRNRARTALEDSLTRLRDAGRIEWADGGQIRPIA